MAKADDLSQITRTLSAPLGELIAAVGRGVAEAQAALDLHTVETFKAVHGGDEANYQVLREVGYQPTWYRIPEVSAEIYVTLSAHGQEQSSGSQGAPPPEDPALEEDALVEPPAEAPPPGRIQLYATPVDASFSNTYDYQLRACSQLKFRIVPVPPSDQADGMKLVPPDLNVTGKPLRDARARLDQLGIAYEVADPRFYSPTEDDIVASIAPAPGEILPGGKALVLTLAMR
jgi:hypothetical protein